MIFTADLLPHLCDQLLDVRALGCLCCANKLCSKYLLSPAGDNHWVKAGKAHCGEKFWSDRPFNEHDPGRYRTKLHMCPWLSVPEERDVTVLSAYANLAAEYDVLGMKAIDCEHGEDAELLLRIRVKGNAHVLGGDRVVSMSARDNDAPMALVHKLDAIQFNNQPTPDEIRLYEELARDIQFMRTVIQ